MPILRRSVVQFCSAPLVRFHTALDKYGHAAANEMQQTNMERLWAAGDVQGWTGAIESANAGGMAAFFMVHGWYGEPKVD